MNRRIILFWTLLGLGRALYADGGMLATPSPNPTSQALSPSVEALSPTAQTSIPILHTLQSTFQAASMQTPLPKDDLETLGHWDIGTSVAYGPETISLGYRNGHWLTGLVLGGSYSTQTSIDFNADNFIYPNYSWEIGLLEKNYCYEPVPHLWLEPTFSFIFSYSYSLSGADDYYVSSLNADAPAYYETNSKVSAYLFLGLDFEYFLPFLPAVSLGGGAGLGLSETWAYIGLSAPNPNLSQIELSNLTAPANGSTYSTAAALTTGSFNSIMNFNVNIYF